jgi:choline dehydrogenase-like flavoprotein
MPTDSTYINNKATTQNTYDAIVVGSGISGGWAAKELCEKGLKVLVLERGRNLQHGDYPTANKSPWEFEHRLTLTTAYKEQNYVQSRHYSYREETKHFFINDQQNKYDEVKPYDWVRADVVGGRSLLWARASYRWSDVHFEANAKDGIGVDWPIRYKDIAPWYDYVESFVGISGNYDGIPSLPDGKFQPPFEMNEVEKYFKQKVEQKFSNRKVIMGRTANLTKPVQGRGICLARDLCYRGCPWGAYFSTNASTFPAAFATNNLTIKPHALVHKVLYDEQKQRAIGVEVIDTITKNTETFYAKIIFLNASTIATTAILLNSVSNRFPNGMGNGSGQLGRNLMDHHKGMAVSADVAGFEDTYTYGRRPTPIYIPQFENITTKNPNFLRGYHFGGSASRQRGANASGIGINFKNDLTEPGPWKMNIYAYGECLPYPDNRITLNHNKKDEWGRPVVAIDCTFRENEMAMHEHAKTTGKEMLEAAGFTNITVKAKMSTPGNANHEMGTARMGHDAKTSVLNKYNQLHEVPNVFITDGSCMTSIACLNPSITFMALTARACDYAVQQLKAMNL